MEVLWNRLTARVTSHRGNASTETTLKYIFLSCFHDFCEKYGNPVLVLRDFSSFFEAFPKIFEPCPLFI